MAEKYRLRRALPITPWLLPLAILCAVGMWTYVNRVMIQHQLLDAALHDRPRGNFSDLYPHWIGARELLLYGHDPYSTAVTREIQQGYYGRALDPARPGDPRDQQGFSYPVFVAFYLAPTLHSEFGVVRKEFFWILLALTLATIPLWLRVIRWPVSFWTQATLMAFTLGTVTVVIGLKLQQLTLLVFAMVTLAIALLAFELPIAAGVMLALSTIKPQLVWLLLLCLIIWTLFDWRHRYRWTASFVVTLALLCVASEYYLPHWIPRFVQAMGRYLNYTDAFSNLDQLLPSPGGWLLKALFVVALLYLAWKNRQFAHDTRAFSAIASLSLAVTIIVIPSRAVYNQVMLLPAVLVLVRDRSLIWHQNRLNRLLLCLGAILLSWSWLSSATLAVFSFFFAPEAMDRAWALPGWTLPQTSVVIAALMLLNCYHSTFDATAKPTPS
jgi:hypothetical protein